MIFDADVPMGNAHGHHEEKPATAAELATALASVKLKKSRSYYGVNADDYNEVYPGIWISSQYFAKSIPMLTKTGITHVLNCAEGSHFMCVNTNATYYDKSGITYKGIAAADAPGYNLSQHFQECIEFMADARKRNGKILVHCLQGWSRSPTIVAAYLMQCEGLSARQALVRIRTMREIHPNQGFLELLTVYEAQLRAALQSKGEEKRASNASS
uniref:Dual specificity protein phosphatase n=1 Tax=Plectus sambesii TaxID=2011161 RepID=A0A914W4G6_9BILA